MHATLSRDVAAALRASAERDRLTNTQVLIAAHTAHGGSLVVERPPAGPFAPRRAPAGREGVYFYLASSELEHLAAEAGRAGFESRSAHFDALLGAYLLG